MRSIQSGAWPRNNCLRFFGESPTLTASPSVPPHKGEGGRSNAEPAMPNPIYAAMPTTIFTVMSGLARETGAINLGQGFPDEPGPRAIRQKAAEAVLDGYNQYPPMPGIPELREAVAGHYSRFQGLDLDWREEITVTSGATEALACAFLALIEPGDEVVVFAPTYDAYLPMIRRAGGVPRVVRLAPPHWRFDRAMLEAAFNERTRLVVLNNPAQSHRQRLPARGPRPPGRVLRALRRRGRMRRGLGTGRVRRRGAYAADGAAPACASGPSRSARQASCSPSPAGRSAGCARRRR